MSDVALVATEAGQVFGDDSDETAIEGGFDQTTNSWSVLHAGAGDAFIAEGSRYSITQPAAVSIAAGDLIPRRMLLFVGRMACVNRHLHTLYPLEISRLSKAGA